ncbi:hypothetical protein E8E12_010270 [Didymella heteroderae]|uniref:Uncharacterized protein n=1 Tax=Didymella heteroderae TaxID=1769908 RepID=A0A9P4WX08_9PLEO|nr:hypothetical protein E8E12_010270 [Didymella heteroderae]
MAATKFRSQIVLVTSAASDIGRATGLELSAQGAFFAISDVITPDRSTKCLTAFLGGQLAQDVINVLGQREQPIQNLMLFDGEESAGPVYALHPIFVDNPITALPSIPMPV